MKLVSAIGLASVELVGGMAAGLSSKVSNGVVAEASLSFPWGSGMQNSVHCPATALSCGAADWDDVTMAANLVVESEG